MDRHMRLIVVAGMAIACAVSLPANAWGPNTQQAVVTTAMHVLNKEGVVRIARLAPEIKAGASAPVETVQKAHPLFTADPLRAIETELHLLSTVRGTSIDPYFAYRLGLLGALISQVSAPLAQEPSVYRTQYYQDVDNNLQQVPLKTSLRKNVDVVPYLERVRVLANVRRDLLLKDYQVGIGFAGIARSSLAEETSRSIEAVADIWFTLITGPSFQSSVSEEQVRRYVVDSLAFYVARKNEAEINSNYTRLSKLAAKTPAMARSIGDIFYEGGLYERAIGEYELVLTHEPGQRDILDKIASYYVRVGDQLASAKRLEQAEEAYARAAKTDPMHSNAEMKRLDMEAQITKRNARQEAARREIEEAAQLLTTAEQYAMKGQHAEAIRALHDAETKYRAITDEFPAESYAATSGLTNTAARLRDLTNDLIQNAQALSGSGAVLDVKKLAEASTRGIDEAALRALNAQQLVGELDRLKDEMRPKLEFQ